MRPHLECDCIICSPITSTSFLFEAYLPLSFNAKLYTSFFLLFTESTLVGVQYTQSHKMLPQATVSCKKASEQVQLILTEIQISQFQSFEGTSSRDPWEVSPDFCSFGFLFLQYFVLIGAFSCTTGGQAITYKVLENFWEFIIESRLVLSELFAKTKWYLLFFNTLAMYKL